MIKEIILKIVFFIISGAITIVVGLLMDYVDILHHDYKIHESLHGTLTFVLGFAGSLAGISTFVAFISFFIWSWKEDDAEDLIIKKK